MILPCHDKIRYLHLIRKRPCQDLGKSWSRIVFLDVAESGGLQGFHVRFVLCHALPDDRACFFGPDRSRPAHDVIAT